MFHHHHPYPPFIHSTTEKLIVGTLPPPRFSTGELLERDVDFCYGSYYNSLWLYIDAIHDIGFRYDNSKEAVRERQQYLWDHKIGICDIVESANRAKIDASDLGMEDIVLRDVIGYLKSYPNIHTLLFTGGNSKNGPEYHFRRHLKDYGKSLTLVSDEIPRIHQFSLEDEMGDIRNIKTVSLISAPGSANRAIGSLPLYRQLKSKNPAFNTFDFRVMQYREFL
ncbi:uracil-DNA glycosylase family protein [Aegicerativicinus sediminis]